MFVCSCGGYLLSVGAQARHAFDFSHNFHGKRIGSEATTKANKCLQVLSKIVDARCACVNERIRK